MARSSATNRSAASTRSTPTVAVVDDFDRADTVSGLGTPPIGNTWGVTGAGFASAHISGGRFVTATSQTVYAYQQLPSTATYIGGIASWTAGGGIDASPVVLIVSPNSALLTDMIHVGIGPSGWFAQLRVNSGSFDSIGSGSLALETDGRPYTLGYSIDAAGGSITIDLPDNSTQTITDIRIKTLAGSWATWELIYGATSPVARWDSVVARTLSASRAVNTTRVTA